MATFKPTLKDPTSPQSEKFEKEFKKTMIRTGAPPTIREGEDMLTEVDGMLSEVEQSLKKKIFSLAKMEALVFSDPKLSAVYEDMAENGEEKYGYHYNETIQNMIFNDYVLNSPKYLQKYKMAIPKEKKRRDKSGINKLKKAGAEKMAQTGLPKQKPVSEEEIEESTGAASSGAYVGRAAWSNKGDLMGGGKKTGQKIRKPIWNTTTISESHYLTDPRSFELYIESLNEESDANFVLNHSQAYGSVDNMSPENQKVIKNDIQNRKWDSNANIKGGLALQEEGTGKLTTPEQVKALGRKLTREDIPNLAGKALYRLAIQLAGQLIPFGWDDLPDINSMWDYIDEQGDMSYEALQIAVKEAVNDRLAEDGMSLDDLGETKLNEKAKSKSQQRFMGMVHAVQKGELSPDKVGGSVAKAADTMSDKDAEDFASTKHKGLPDHVDETMGQPDIDYLVKAYEILNSGPHYDPAKAEHFRNNLLQMDDAQAQQVSRRLDGMLKQMGYKNPQDVMNFQSKFNEEMTMNNYTITVQHDNGKTKIRTTASDKNAAIQKIMSSENCPASAIVDVVEEPLKEDTQTMIQNNGNSMSNSAQAVGDQSNDTPMGTQQSGGLNEADTKLLEEINNELEAFSIHHNKLKLMSEDRKTTSQILNKRVNDENPKNFKKDLQHSGVKQVIDIEKELEWKDQQTDVGDDPQKLGQDIEKKAIEVSDMKGDEALKNVGDSTNQDGDEIPKRNLTSKEQEEVDLYRNGLHSYNYDNEPSERFVERMKADQGAFFEMGEKQKAFKADAPMYDKDTQPIDDGIEKVQFDKNLKQKGDKVAWNERMGIGSNVKLAESLISGRFSNEIGKSHIIDFKMSDVVGEVNEEASQYLFPLNFTGLGNKYLAKTIDKKVIVNEAVVGVMESHKFFTNGKDVFAMKNPVQSLNEGEVKVKPVVNEEVDKMKHLLGYKPESYVSTKGVKQNRKF